MAPSQPDPHLKSIFCRSGTILELKFNGAFPFWMQRIVHGLGLRRTSCSKYVQAAEQLGDVPWNRVERRTAWTVY